MRGFAPLVALVAASMGPALLVAQSTAPPQLAELLARVGTYIADYERQVSGVVSEEHYTQHQGFAIRTLKSDVLILNGGAAGFVGLRDVFEVDQRPVRDHSDRLLALMSKPAPDAMAQARRLADEGARFNIGGLNRTINMPTVALFFLREANQARSTWTLGGKSKIDGHDVIELRFTEKAMPRSIETKDQAAAYGRFWIEPDSGRLVRSSLSLDSVGVRGQVTVTFGPVPTLALWMPSLMTDSYRSRNLSLRAGDIEGKAEYRNFRSFSVDVATIVR